MECRHKAKEFECAFCSQLKYIPTITKVCGVPSCSGNTYLTSTYPQSLNGTCENLVASSGNIQIEYVPPSQDKSKSKSPHSPLFQTLLSSPTGQSLPTYVSYPVKIGEQIFHITSLSDLFQKDISGGLCQAPSTVSQCSFLTG